MSDEFNDEHSGRGGSYVAGEDGKRVPQAAAVTPSAPAAQPANPDAPAKTTKQPKMKGASNA
jgi:hypothetical protein